MNGKPLERQIFTWRLNLIVNNYKISVVLRSSVKIKGLINGYRILNLIDFFFSTFHDQDHDNRGSDAPHGPRVTTQ